MENATDIIATVERLGGFLVLLLGAVGALYTAISVGRKALIEAESKAQTDRTNLEITQKTRPLEATKAMQELYDQFVEDMDEKFKIMNGELGKLREQQKDTESKLRLVTGERNLFKEAGLRLISAIEEGLTIRSRISVELNNCSVCSVADAALLKTLTEVKNLFEIGVRKD